MGRQHRRRPPHPNGPALIRLPASARPRAIPDTGEEGEDLCEADAYGGDGEGAGVSGGGELLAESAGEGAIVCELVPPRPHALHSPSPVLRVPGPQQDTADVPGAPHAGDVLAAAAAAPREEFQGRAADFGQAARGDVLAGPR